MTAPGLQQKWKHVTNLANRPPTIEDVAQKARVSIATVSRVLNKVPRGVSSSLRRRVLNAAQALSYRPNAVARSLQNRRTYTLGLLVTDIANSFFAEIARGVEDVCRKRDYSLFICNTDRNRATTKKYIDVLYEKRVDGILIMAGGTPGEQPFEALPSNGIPVVVIGRFGTPVPAIRIDNVKGGWIAAEHLINLGHRQIGIILGPRRSTTSRDVLTGHRQAFAEHGIPMCEDWVLYGDTQAESALVLTERLLRTTPRPTGLLTITDQAAMGAIRAAVNLGLHVPQDVSVIGYDGIKLASFMNPSPTTLSIPLQKIGATAAEMLLRLGAGQTVDREVWFVPELIVRETTSPPRPLSTGSRLGK